MHDNLLRISNSEYQAVPSIEIEFLWLKVCDERISSNLGVDP
jgi:hypothetical protein